MSASALPRLPNALVLPAVWRRLQLSLAKHPSLGGHAKMALRVSKLVPYYSYPQAEVLRVDGAPAHIEAQRRAASERLGKTLRLRSPKTLEASAGLAAGIADADFVQAHRVPFAFRTWAQAQLPVGSVAAATRGNEVCDLDGNWSWDLSGSYGVNLFGYDFYKACMRQAMEDAEALGPILGPYHPAILENVARLQQISGKEQVSFHMSGTEAVMQAVRLARYHTGKSHVVRFCGAYHGWWDGVQAGVGNPRPAHEVYTLNDMHPATLRVLEGRNDIACVLVNPLQALSPNAAAPSDSTLMSNGRKASLNKQAYGQWLAELRDVCTRRGIALIMDEVFLGFRLAAGGAQAYFGVQADLVTYGKTLGGGFPVGVVCGDTRWMKRWKPESPADVCFARGTFNSHPYVMTAMRAFLRHLDQPEVQASYHGLDGLWNGRAAVLSQDMARLGAPVRFANLTSVWTTLYDQPGRYHWMYQYYLRKHGLFVPWIGTGRFIFSHSLSESDWQDIRGRMLAAAAEMLADGWWWQAPASQGPSIGRQLAKETMATLLGRPLPLPQH